MWQKYLRNNKEDRSTSVGAEIWRLPTALGSGGPSDDTVHHMYLKRVNVRQDLPTLGARVNGNTPGLLPMLPAHVLGSSLKQVSLLVRVAGSRPVPALHFHQGLPTASIFKVIVLFQQNGELQGQLLLFLMDLLPCCPLSMEI